MRWLQGVLYLWLFSALVVPVSARLSPHAPVREFKLPRFAENGYTEWVLQGSSGHYESRIDPHLGYGLTYLFC